MSRQENLFRRLSQLEAQLVAELLPELVRVVDSGDFAVFMWMPQTQSFLPAVLYDRSARQITDLVEHIETLRSKLELPLDDGPAHLYRNACFAYSNVEEAHRRGPKRLAQELAAHLRAFRDARS